MDVALKIDGITKQFGPTVANDHINLEIGRGEIHAILGENGAGKSTLMNILYGLYKPDAGSIAVYDQPAEINSPRDAAALGIQMVHQHFMLGLPFTVAENLVLGQEPRTATFLLDRRGAEEAVQSLSARYGLNVNPGARVETLSVGERQRVEILKALYREARILILDEPTAVLTPLETEELFDIMRRLRAEQKTVIFITHKLHEVMSVADRVTVLRQGRLVGTRAIEQVDEKQLVEMMVGRLVEAELSAGPVASAEEVLQVRSLSAVDRVRGVEVLHDVSLDIRSGEILGIAGVEGNGQTEFVEVLIGLRPATSGSVLVDGVELLGLSPRKIMQRGLVCIHEDRQTRGVIGDFTVSENLILGEHFQPPFRQGFMLDATAIREHVVGLIEDFDIRPPRPEMQAKYLSGGNQQKLIAARELSAKHIRVLIASQPTRGLDIGATMFIHRYLREMRSKGIAVLLLSADLDEVKLLSDRVAVMYKGEIAAVGPKDSFTDAELGALMLRGRRAGGPVGAAS